MSFYTKRINDNSLQSNLKSCHKVTITTSKVHQAILKSVHWTIYLHWANQEFWFEKERPNELTNVDWFWSFLFVCKVKFEEVKLKSDLDPTYMTQVHTSALRCCNEEASNISLILSNSVDINATMCYHCFLFGSPFTVSPAFCLRKQGSWAPLRNSFNFYRLSRSRTAGLFYTYFH